MTVVSDANISANSTLGAVDSYAVSGTLTISAAQANGIPITGAGNVTLVGLGTDQVDLSQVTASGTKTTNIASSTALNTGTDLGAFALTVASGQTLTLSAAQANGTSISGAGNVAVTGLGADQVDLSQITVTGTKSATVAGDAALNAATNLGDFAIDLAGGQSLTLSAAQADGVSITGTGNVTVTGLDAAAVDLSGATVSGTLIAEVPLSATLAAGTDLGGFGATVASGQTLTLSAAQANGVSVSGAGNVLVTSLGSTLADLSQVTAAGTKTASVPADATLDANTSLGTFAVVVSGGQTLTLSAAQANGQAISGTGNVAVTALGADAVDLSQTVAAGTKTANVPTSATLNAATDLGSFAVTVANGQTLTLSAAQADAHTITGGSAIISGDVTANADLTGIGSALSFEGGSIDVAGGQTLTLTMAQATGQTISGAGALLVDGDVASSADLTGISAFLEFTSNTVDVASGQSLTLTAIQASDVGITGAGTLSVSGDAPAAADYSGITADISVPSGATLSLDTAQLAAMDSAAKPIAGPGSVALSGDATTLGSLSGHITADLSVPAGQTLVITADQANGLSLAGAGNVSITGLGSAAADLSGIAATGTVTVTTTGDPTLDASTDLGNAILQIPAGRSVTVTADQASGKTITGSDGTLVVTGTINNAGTFAQWQAGTVDLRGATLGIADLALPNTSRFILTYDQANDLGDITGTDDTNTIVIDVSSADFVGNEATIDFNIEGRDGNDHVVFDFGAQAGNTIVLSGTSAIDLGAGTADRLESSNGNVNIAAATVENVEQLAINSTISMTASQYQELGSDLSALEGAGEVQITVEAGYDADIDGPLDFSGLGFTPGGSTPPTIRIDASANEGFAEEDIIQPATTDEPVIILVRYHNQTDYSVLGGFGPDRAFFSPETAVFNGDQFAALVKAIENEETGVSGSDASIVQFIKLSGDILLTPVDDKLNLDLSTDNLVGVGIIYDGNAIEVADTNLLTLTATQANGGTIVGEGSLVITDLDAAPSDLDLSGVTVEDASLEVTSGALDLTSMTSLNLGTISLSVVAPASVTMTAAQANGTSVTGDGTVVLTELGTAEVDLSGVTVTGGFSTTIAGDLTLNSLSKLGNLQLGLADGVTLTLQPAQLDGRTIGLDAGATGAVLNFAGDVSGLSLGGIASDISFSVDAARNLTLTASQANGQGIGGAGNVYVTSLGETVVDLSGITATGIKSANVPGNTEVPDGTNLGEFDLTVSSGATLTLTAERAGGLAISGLGNVTVTDIGPSVVDLSQITVSGARIVDITSGTTLNGSTDLQGFSVTVQTGQTLTLSATQANGLSISGPGSVVVTGLGTAPVDLTGITASASTTIGSGDLTLDLDTDLGSVDVTVAGGASLTLTAGQIDGVSIGGAGAVTVAALGATTDLSNVDPSVTLTAVVLSTLDVRANATLGSVDVYRVTGDLTLGAAQADGVDIEGAGEITITALSNGTDLSNVAASGTVAATVTNSIDVSANTTLANVDSYVVEAAGTLELSAAQATGKPITGAGNVSVVDIGTDPFDLSNVTVSGSRTATVAQSTTLAETTDLDAFAITVASGQALTLTADQATGLSISGTGGAVTVTDPGGTAFDLSGVTVTGDRTLALTDTLSLASGTDLGTFSVTVAADETLTLSAAQATTRSISGAGDLVVTELAADTNLANVAVTGTVLAEVSSTVDITGNANLEPVDAYSVSGALTLTAAQADGVVVDGAGTVTVTGLGTQAVDFSEITATASTTIASGDLTLDGGTVLGSVAVTVGAGASLTLSASQADGTTIAGAGDVHLTALTEGADLSGVDPAGTLTAQVNTTLDISDNITLDGIETYQVSGALTLGAAQATGRAISGTGSVTVVNVGTTAFDLSGVTVSGDRTVEIASSLTLPAGTNLGSFKLAVNADQTFVLTADQANGLTIEGGGNVTVTPMGQTTDLSNVTATGTVTAQFASSLDVSGNTTLGVVDAYHVLSGHTLTLSGAQATGRSVTGPGTVNITAIAADTDFSGVSALGTKTAIAVADIDVSANDTLDAIDVFQADAGGKLTMTAVQADGRNITGAGDVTATNFGATAVDLSATTATGTLTVTLAGDTTVPDGTNFGNFGLFIGAPQTLTITAEQADGLTMNGTGTVIVTGDPEGFDFSGISGTLTVFFPDGGDILTIEAGETVEMTVVEASSYLAIEGDGTLGLYENGELLFDSLSIASTLTLIVPASRTLTLTAEQANGLILGGDGTLEATGSVADGDFSAISSSLNLSGATLTGTTTLPAEIGSGKTMTLTAEQASGIALGGDGTLVVTGSLADADFSGVTANLNLSGAVLTGTLTLPATVDAGKTITLTAEQVDGQALAGGGTLEVVGAGADGSTVDTTDISAVQLDTIFNSLGALTRIVTNDAGNVQLDAADIDPISEADGTLTIAGTAAIDVVNAQLQTFTDGTAPSVLNLLALEFEGLSAALSLVPDRLTVDGSHPDAIKAFWIPLDQAAEAGTPDIETSFAYLGNDYVRYLNAGGTPMLDIVKVPTGVAQSLHDSLLGKLNDGEIAENFPDAEDDPRTDAARAFGDRPYHDGAIADNGFYSDVSTLSGVMGWDIAHGFDYPASLPSFYGIIDLDNTITGQDTDDFLFGGAGDDSIDGGDGEDTAPYVSDRADFALVYDSDAEAWTIDDAAAAGTNEGTDTLNSIEEIQFGNGSTMEFNAALANGFLPVGGNGNTGFVVDTNPDSGVEVGLKAKEAHTDNDLSPDMGTYHSFAGFGLQSSTPGDLDPTLAKWDVDLSVDVSGSGKTIGDFEVLLTLDPDPAAGVPTKDFVLDINNIPGLTEQEQQAISGESVYQVSENLGSDLWDTYFSDFNFDPRVPGEYRFELTVNDPASGDLVSESAIVVDVQPGLLVDSARDPANDGELNADGVAQFATIQAAVEAAATGDTIQVLAGQYAISSTIEIDKPITLLGAQAGVDPRTAAGLRTIGSDDESIIDGRTTNAEGDVVTLKNLIRIAADDVVIDGFDVGNGTGDLIESKIEIANLVVRNNFVHDSTGDEGMQIRKAADAVIEYNHVTDTAGDGINLSSNSTDGTIRFNEVHDIHSPDAAIYVYDATNTTIEGNLVYDVTDNDGIKLGDKEGDDELNSGGQIIDNTVRGTVQDGISVYMSDVTVQGNDVSGSTSENGAIYVAHNVSNIAITGNTLHDNGDATDDRVTFAIRIGKNAGQTQTEVSITDNTFTDNEAQIYFKNGSVSNEATLVADNTFDDTASVGINHLVGTISQDSATIQSAVDTTSEGDAILIAGGTYGESVNVTKALIFVGMGVDQTIMTPGSGSAFVLSGDLGAANTVSFDGIGFVGATHSGIQAGTNQSDGSGDVTLGTLLVTNSHFEHNAVNGLHVLNADAPTPHTNLANVIVTDSTFVENGHPGGSSGDGDIIFYQYNGDATLRNLTLDGGDRPIDKNTHTIDHAAENGIQFRADNGSLGTVTIEDVSITGTYEKVAVAFYRFDDVNGLTLNDVDITAETGWSLSYNFDGIGGDIDFSKFTGLTYAQTAALQDETGAGTDNTFVGTDNQDFFRPRGGTDVVDGQGGTDTISYAGEPAGVTVDLANETATDGTGGTDSVLNVENATGSSHADTLIGDAGANALTGKAGDDELQGAAGDDVIAGDEGEDTAVYLGSQLDFDISTDSSSLALIVRDTNSADGDEGTDTLTTTEILQFSDGTVRPEAQLARAVAEDNTADDDRFHPGTGLSDTNFLVSDNTAEGIEAALKIHNRYHGDVDADGTIYHTNIGFSSGSAGLWNFNYSVISYGIGGESGRPISDFDIIVSADFIDIKGNRSDGIMTFDAQAHEAYWDSVGAPERYYKDDSGETDGLQNSQNIGWYAGAAYDAEAPGTYELTLTVTDKATGETVASTTATVDVAADITVAADGSGDYETIQDAIDNASAGDTIVVKAGTYAPFGTSIGGPANLMILGAAGALIEAATIGAVPAVGRIVDLRADGTVLDGFTITGPGGDAGVSVGVSITGQGVTVTNNTISDVLTGIQTTTQYAAGNNTIADNTIDSNYGISLQNTDNTVTGNDVTAVVEGLGVLAGVNTLSDNSFAVDAGGQALGLYAGAVASTLATSDNIVTIGEGDDLTNAAALAGDNGTLNVGDGDYTSGSPALVSVENVTVTGGAGANGYRPDTFLTVWTGYIADT